VFSAFKGAAMKRMVAGVLLSLGAHAASAQLVNVIGARLQDRVHGVLSLMAYSVVPDLASSTLSVSDASTSNPNVYMTQLAGGFNVSKESPLYLEGGIAYSRYDPTFIATDGAEARELPTKWNSMTLTGGVGWDFPLDWSLPVGGTFKFRPIFNFALGRMQSDASVANWYVGKELGYELEFLKKGHVDAYGLGGSAMLVYNRFRPESETEVELRYTNILLQNYGGPDFLRSSASAITTSLYARYRAPTGWHALDRPVRYVAEFSHSNYLGDQSEAMGFSALSTIGGGLELDTSAHDIWITRTRLVIRHMFGNNVKGTSIGLAVSF
jgi:hypothetical protein